MGPRTRNLLRKYHAYASLRRCRAQSSELLTIFSTGRPPLPHAGACRDAVHYGGDHAKAEDRDARAGTPTSPTSALAPAGFRCPGCGASGPGGRGARLGPGVGPWADHGRAQRLYGRRDQPALARGRGRSRPASPARHLRRHGLRRRAAARPAGASLCQGAWRRGPATVAGADLACRPAEAALVNGMLAHADETDDTHAASHSHPGCAVVPAALAVGERLASTAPLPARGGARLRCRAAR